MSYTKVLTFAMILIGMSLQAQSPETVTKYNEGVAAAKEKNYEAAIVAYSAAITSDPLYSKAYYGRGTAKMSIKDYPAAAVDFKKCLKLDQENGKAHYYAGYSLMNMEQNLSLIHI